VSDASGWARSIYDRYVDVGTPPTVLTVSPEHPSLVLSCRYSNSADLLCQLRQVLELSVSQALSSALQNTVIG
jgi:hypothetical protein